MTDIPLHHPVFSPTDLPTLRAQLREKATLAYTMFVLSAMAAGKRTMKLPDGVVPGFRAAFVNERMAAAGIEGRVADQPNRRERRRAKQLIKKHWKRVHENEYRAAMGLGPIVE
jgi:hypothetical protein